MFCLYIIGELLVFLANVHGLFRTSLSCWSCLPSKQRKSLRNLHVSSCRILWYTGYYPGAKATKVCPEYIFTWVFSRETFTNGLCFAEIKKEIAAILLEFLESPYVTRDDDAPTDGEQDDDDDDPTAEDDDLTDEVDDDDPADEDVWLCTECFAWDHKIVGAIVLKECCISSIKPLSTESLLFLESWSVEAHGIMNLFLSTIALYYIAKQSCWFFLRKWGKEVAFGYWDIKASSMDGWVDGWMDGWMSLLVIVNFIYLLSLMVSLIFASMHCYKCQI